MRYLLAIITAFSTSVACADEPYALFIFPAGGQRGTTVDVRIGGMNLHAECPLHWSGSGVAAPKTIRRTETLWFEGPVIAQPESQRSEDYPSDYAAKLVIAPNAAGSQRFRVATSQGVTTSLPFVLGDDPEIVEQETDGTAIPVDVSLPVTINGRVFPREDTDEWRFQARKGQTVRCEVVSERLGYPLDAQIEVVDAAGRRLAHNSDYYGSDPLIVFTAPADGSYRVRIFDSAYGGLQTFVYRLTLSDRPHVLSIYPLGGKRGTKVPVTLTGVNVPTAPQTLEIPADVADEFAARFTFPAGSVTADRTNHQTQNTKHETQNTNPVFLEAGALDETLEHEPNNQPADLKVAPLTAPQVLNGRIDRAGDVDWWTITAKKDRPLEFDLRAGRLGSPLDSVVAIETEDGRSVIENDDFSGNDSDSRFRFQPPIDGTYRVRVADRSPRRGGPEFAYRLVIAPAPEPGYRLTLAADALTIPRAGTGKLKVNVERFAGFNEPIKLEALNLPEGVTLTGGAEIAPSRPSTDLTFTAGETAKIEFRGVTIRGQAAPKPVPPPKPAKNAPAAPPVAVEPPKLPPHWTQTASLQPVAANPNAPAQTSQVTFRGEAPLTEVALAVAMPTPFRTVASFGLPFAPRGSVFRRKFTIERNGFDGPLQVSLTEKQVRHLQGVTGPTITVPAGVDQFEYPASMAPWMDMGRTSRAHVQLVGTVTDESGRKHLVSYTSTHQNEQISLIIGPARLNLALSPENVVPVTEMASEVRVSIDRDAGLDGPVRIELVVPRHIRGVSAEPVTAEPGENEALLKIRFASDAGPFNMPLVVRASHGEGVDRNITEAPLEIVR
jgi:hypothetical protein